MKDFMTDINIVSTFENARGYIKDVEESKDDIDAAWRRHMIEPFWTQITEGVGRDVSFMKPAAVLDIFALKKQLIIFSRLSIDALRLEFDKITAALPKNCEEPVLVALYPACDGDKALKERQNGVVGCCPDGNVIIRINPLAQDYYKWVLFVFAHEYHHSVWGYNMWLSGANLCGAFYEAMIIEGQADLFAESLFPQLTPKWNRPFDGATEAALWERCKTDASIHGACMFGDESIGLPWCMGYALGRAIVGDYMQKNPDISFMELIKITPNDILQGSRFNSGASCGHTVF
jgi:hypothetical protein